MDIFEEDDTEKSTPSKGDDSGKLSDKDFLEKWNEVSGRKDKTLDAVRKHQEEVRKAFSEKGRKKEDDENQCLCPSGVGLLLPKRNENACWTSNWVGS